MSVTATGPSSKSSLAAQLGRIHVGLREELEVTRHVFRSEPAYVVRDPITFTSQRLERQDYDVYVSIDSNRPLGEIFRELVDRGKLAVEDEERFFQFVVTLHRLGFLRLPVNDDRLLYRRHVARKDAAGRGRIMNLLFLRVPLWNPDAFLSRTVRFTRFLFTPWFLFLWLGWVGAALYVVFANWHDLHEPVSGVLAAANLPLLWVTLVVLKIFHEFGHAYACKHYGGHVPEMGAYLILFTPCAYMDATASWGFTRTRERVIVCLGGVYFEAFIAALAVFVWGLAEQPLLKSLAYNVMFLASIVTVLFNLNPLMRYDGYYIVSDLTEIPNLRQRANRFVLNRLKRWFLGINSTTEPGGRSLRATLWTYGVSAAVYRVCLLTAIAALLISKLLIVGAALSAFILGGLLCTMLKNLLAYFWYAEETRGCRARAVVFSAFLVLLIPAAILLAPVPSSVHAAAVIRAETETFLRNPTPGFLVETGSQEGDYVSAGQIVARLENDLLVESALHARAEREASDIRLDAYRATSPVLSLQEVARRGAIDHAAAAAEHRLNELAVVAPIDGRVVDYVLEDQIGRYMEAGSPIALVHSGRWQARTILTDAQFTRARPCQGQVVELRVAADPGRLLTGTIVGINPTASRMITEISMTHVGGGAIPVNPDTLEAADAYFEITIDLADDAETPDALYGSTAVVRLDVAPEPLGTHLLRRGLRFWNQILEN